MSSEVLATVSELAAAQWGLLTTKQAVARGVTRMQLVRLVDAGLLDRVEQGIYTMVSSTDSFQALHAAWLSLDPGRTVEQRINKSREAIVASHTSAAALHSMGDLLNDVPELNTIRRKQTIRAIRLHRLPLTPDDVVLIDALPTTTPERTIADLVQSGHDLTHVADAIKDGHLSGILDLEKLREKLDTVAHRTAYGDGHELLENLLDLVGLSTAALVTSTAKSPVGQLIAATAIQHYQEGLFDQFSTPALTSGVAEAMKQMMASASIANLATPALTSGVAEAMKQMMASASIANLATPALTSGVAEAMKQMNGASRGFTFKDDPHKILQNTRAEPAEEKEK
jgi:predicted transcriptional regulator of viral defense system